MKTYKASAPKVMMVIILVWAVAFLTWIFLAKFHNTTKKIEVKGSRIVGETVNLKKDKTYVFEIKSDTTDYFHVPAFHTFGKVEPGKTLVLQFDAKLEGEFPVVFDSSNQVIGRIIVN